MSTQRYSVGDNVQLIYTVGSTATTAPQNSVVNLVVRLPSTNPAIEGTDLKFLSSQLTKSIPSSSSTVKHWARWTRLVTLTRRGRWTYQFTSTGIILTSAGGALGVMGPLASTST